MDTVILRLFPDGREEQDLVLHPHKVETSLLDAVPPLSAFVFCDYKYSAELFANSPETVSDLMMTINGDPVHIKYQEDGKISFCDDVFGERIFTDCYGFVQISIAFLQEGSRYTFESDYIQVMVRKGKQNESVRRMAEYVYSHNEALLYGSSVLPRDKGGLKENAVKTLESCILLLKTIYQMFEQNYRYFRINSRFVTIPVEQIDSFEKMRYATNRTVQYISQHPEELQRVNTTGIKIGRNKYIPHKTLIANNTPSYNIYENRVIVGFLKTIYVSVGDIQSNIESLIKNYSQEPIEANGYVSSSYFFYTSTVHTLQTHIIDLQNIKFQFAQLMASYSNIFKVDDLRVVAPPKPTPIFMSVPQYRQLYDCIVSWFRMGIYNLEKEKYMLSFIRASALYEAYIVTKLMAFFGEKGFLLTKSKKINYTFSGRTFYKNTLCNNTFEFENSDTKITLWYQPVIYNEDRREKTGIGLYRNTSLSIPKATGEDSVGTYYSPDFLVRVTNNGTPGAKYMIADAKFSTVNNVKLYQVLPLVYKYIFSITPISQEDQLIGMCIFNGQSNYDKDSVVDIYDKSLTPKRISPFAEIFTMTENSVDNHDNQTALLTELFCRFGI